MIELLDEDWTHVVRVKCTICDTVRIVQDFEGYELFVDRHKRCTTEVPVDGFIIGVN